MTQKPTKPHKKRKSQAKTLRNQAIVSEAVTTDQTTTELAEKYGVSRETISRILNSDEMKNLVKLGDQRLHLMMTKALDTLDWAMENKAEFGVTGAAVQSAFKVLKSLGVLKETVDLNHNFPKPTVIRRSDGTETILGTEEEK